MFEGDEYDEQEDLSLAGLMSFRQSNLIYLVYHSAVLKLASAELTHM